MTGLFELLDARFALESGLCTDPCSSTTSSRACLHHGRFKTNRHTVETSFSYFCEDCHLHAHAYVGMYVDRISNAAAWYSFGITSQADWPLQCGGRNKQNAFIPGLKSLYPLISTMTNSVS